MHGLSLCLFHHPEVDGKKGTAWGIVYPITSWLIVRNAWPESLSIPSPLGLWWEMHGLSLCLSHHPLVYGEKCMALVFVYPITPSFMVRNAWPESLSIPSPLCLWWEMHGLSLCLSHHPLVYGEKCMAWVFVYPITLWLMVRNAWPEPLSIPSPCGLWWEMHGLSHCLSHHPVAYGEKCMAWAIVYPITLWLMVIHTWPEPLSIPSPCSWWWEKHGLSHCISITLWLMVRNASLSSLWVYVEKCMAQITAYTSTLQYRQSGVSDAQARMDVSINKLSELFTHLPAI